MFAEALIVTEEIYDVREYRNCALTFDTYFTMARAGMFPGACARGRIFTVQAEENRLENERNQLQGRRNDLNMLLLRSTNSMSVYEWGARERAAADWSRG